MHSPADDPAVNMDRDTGQATRENFDPTTTEAFVENAVTHGLEPRAGGGSIEVSVVRRGDLLELSVADDGAGAARGRGGSGASIGLNNTSGRLEGLYGSAARVVVEERSPQGTLVSIRIPLDTQACTTPRTSGALA